MALWFHVHESPLVPPQVFPPWTKYTVSFACRFSIKQVVLATWRLLSGRLGFIVVLFSIFDGLVFLLHRISHQAVNQSKVVSGTAHHGQCFFS